MPVFFSEIAADWNDAQNHSMNAPQFIAFKKGKDKKGTRVYLEFSFKGEDMHITMTLAPGGECTAFHVTSDTAPSGFLSSKPGKGAAGGSKTVKSKPSCYYDFTISEVADDYSITFAKTTQLLMAGEDKAAKVVNGVINATLESAVHQFMREFLYYMMISDHGSLG